MNCFFFFLSLLLVLPARGMQKMPRDLISVIFTQLFECASYQEMEHDFYHLSLVDKWHKKLMDSELMQKVVLARLAIIMVEQNIPWSKVMPITSAVKANMPLYIHYHLKKESNKPLKDHDDSRLATMLEHAVSAHALKSVRYLLRYPVDINAKNYKEETVLHTAVRANFAQAIPLLVENGADINAQDKYGDTPLIDFCRVDHQSYEVGKALLAYPGCDVKIQNREGNTALHYAISNRLDHDFVATLIERGALEDEENYTAQLISVVLARAKISKRKNERAKIP